MEYTLIETKFPTGTVEEKPVFIQSDSEGERSSVNIFHSLSISQDQKHQMMAECEELLIDEHGHYWFIEMNTKRHASSRVFLYAENGELLQHYVFNGKATLYEFTNCIIAACEGPDYKGYIYKINKESYQLEKNWVLEGFLWDVSMHCNSLYVTAYLPKQDEALLYQLNGQTSMTQSLGYGFYPTSLVKSGNQFYLAANYPFSSQKGTVMTLSLAGMKLEERDVGISVRELFTHDDCLVLHGLDYITGTAETLTYVHNLSQQKATYHIPKVTHIKQHNAYLLLFNHKLKTIMYWSHERRKITRVLHWSGSKKLPTFHSPVINH